MEIHAIDKNTIDQDTKEPFVAASQKKIIECHCQELSLKVQKMAVEDCEGAEDALQLPLHYCCACSTDVGDQRRLSWVELTSTYDRSKTPPLKAASKKQAQGLSLKVQKWAAEDATRRSWVDLTSTYDRSTIPVSEKQAQASQKTPKPQGFLLKTIRQVKSVGSRLGELPSAKEAVDENPLPIAKSSGQEHSASDTRPASSPAIASQRPDHRFSTDQPGHCKNPTKELPRKVVLGATFTPSLPTTPNTPKSQHT